MSSHDMSYDPTLHDSQMVAVYDTAKEAEHARSKLLDAGVAASDIQLIASDDQAGGTSTTSSAPRDEGFWGSVKNLFAPDDDYNTYHAALGRGHVMLSVTPTGTVDRDHILHVLEGTNPIDIDANSDDWNSGSAPLGTAQLGSTQGLSAQADMGMVSPGTSAGVPGAIHGEREVPAVGASSVGASSVGASSVGANSVGGAPDDTIQLVQERLRVGKREVAKGAVRVRSYVVERPVEEQVRLHDETVSVERRPVDRPVTGAEAGLFQERTLEARSTTEEAVVQKEARVVEEIGLKKQASVRTETVRDTVRETKVEIDDQTIPAATVSGTTVSGTTVGGTTVGGSTVSGTTVTDAPVPNAPRK